MPCFFFNFCLTKCIVFLWGYVISSQQNWAEQSFNLFHFLCYTNRLNPRIFFGLFAQMYFCLFHGRLELCCKTCNSSSKPQTLPKNYPTDFPHLKPTQASICCAAPQGEFLEVFRLKYKILCHKWQRILHITLKWCLQSFEDSCCQIKWLTVLMVYYFFTI